MCAFFFFLSFAPTIDVRELYTVTTDDREQPPELNTDVDLETSEPLPIIPKEEPNEYDISWGTEPHEGPREADNFINPDCIKNDPDAEDSFQIQVVEYQPTSSASVSANNDIDKVSGDLVAATDCLQLSMGEESTYEDPGPKKKKSSKRKVYLFIPY